MIVGALSIGSLLTALGVSDAEVTQALLGKGLDRLLKEGSFAEGREWLRRYIAVHGFDMRDPKLVAWMYRYNDWVEDQRVETGYDDGTLAIYHHGLVRVKWSERPGSEVRGSEEARAQGLIPAPDWEVEPRQKLYAFFVGDDHLVGASQDPRAASSDFWRPPKRAHWQIDEITDVPFTLTQRLVMQSTPTPYFQDGYEAANELQYYPSTTLISSFTRPKRS